LSPRSWNSPQALDCDKENFTRDKMFCPNKKGKKDKNGEKCYFVFYLKRARMAIKRAKKGEITG
jgi:hypothetical protein